MKQARVIADPAFVVGDVDRRLFGSFVEHLGRSVYDGIYEPGHATADERGFRRDVMALVRELGVSMLRYPGGNFVSGYNWQDGVGPRDQRPQRMDLAWHTRESNQVGLDEFGAFCKEVGSDLMLAVNLGTAGAREALELLEYANISDGSSWSQARRRNGVPDPWNVRMWCLGNEMDGPWQLGHRSADEYGAIASRTAKAMKMLDPTLELVVCGSSHRKMPTFGSWERTVLEHCYDDVEYVSCHSYYEERNGDRASFLASALDMDAFIDAVAATVEHVRAIRGASKRIRISFDEWNVWYIERGREQDTITGIDNWPTAPRLLENIYSVTDAVVVGSLIISLLNHADWVRSASLAQLVNVVAPIMTEPGGPAWRQTTFHPFAISSRLARGQALQLSIDTPSTDTAVYGPTPDLTASVTFDAEAGSLSTLMVNRSLTEPLQVSVDLSRFGAAAVNEAWLLADHDLDACNTLADPERVKLGPLQTKLDGGVLTATLPPVAWAAVATKTVQ